MNLITLYSTLISMPFQTSTPTFSKNALSKNAKALKLLLACIAIMQNIVKKTVYLQQFKQKVIKKQTEIAVQI